jgi:hypothetical protein
LGPWLGNVRLPCNSATAFILATPLPFQNLVLLIAASFLGVDGLDIFLDLFQIRRPSCWLQAPTSARLE